VRQILEPTADDTNQSSRHDTHCAERPPVFATGEQHATCK
jgi:hypothetical protein